MGSTTKRLVKFNAVPYCIKVAKFYAVPYVLYKKYSRVKPTNWLKAFNAQVTQWRGCYDDICEYSRTEATSNSPEFAKKKRESVVT